MSAIKKLVLANLEATKARLSEGRQWIGIKNLEIPDEVQPRKRFEKDWAADLAKWFKEGSQFPVARVYQLPDARLIQAEGHHRRFALQSINQEDMYCDVVNGTMEEAIVYAAGSNRANRGILEMSDKDITKAVEMLLAIPSWWGKSSVLLGRHVGCSSNKASMIRKRYSEEHGKPILGFVERSDGITQAAKCRGRHSRGVTICYTNGNYEGRYKGTKFKGKTEALLKAKLQEHFKQEDKRASSLKKREFTRRLQNHGFRATCWGKSFPEFKGMVGFGCIVVACDFGEATTLIQSVGNVKLLLSSVGRTVANRQRERHATRSVILCYREDGPKEAIELFEEAGIEFMTPDELIASLGPVIPDEVKAEVNSRIDAV